MNSYQSNADVLLCGDFNARTSSLNDFICNDNGSYLPIYDDYRLDVNIQQRYSRDGVIDTRGRELIDTCIGNQLRFLNGRVLGDLFGNYTCYTPNGCSVVDYAIASDCMLNKILYFSVSPFLPTLSDCHCKLSLSILADFDIDHSDETKQITHDMPTKFKWNDRSSDLFQSVLKGMENQERIGNFLIDSASKVLTRQNKFQSKKRMVQTKSKKWFDKDLRSMRNKLMYYGRIYSLYPNDKAVHDKYYKLYREYTKSRKKRLNSLN
ncbi:hypothetical protein SNE40_004767 [Patella caerulea]|uniref:Endonuclease/exonuclease/phosphatase domain-containing protein n=1 Tax=Patella caerulea TaxID=87958 RepID=A0AAN8K5D6_PATCE